MSDTSVENISSHIIPRRNICISPPKRLATYNSGISYLYMLGTFKSSIKFIIQARIVRPKAPKNIPSLQDDLSFVSEVNGTKTPLQDRELKLPYNKQEINQLPLIEGICLI